MSLETGDYIADLNPSNPVGATDYKSQGDDHLRLVKKCVQQSFANVSGAVTLTHTQINDAARKSADNTFTGTNVISSTDPVLVITETDAGANEKNWIVRATGSAFAISTATDAAPTTAVENFITVTRTGTEVNIVNVLGDEFQVDAATLDFNGTADFSGAVQLNGTVTCAGSLINQAVTNSVLAITGGTGAANTAGASIQLFGSTHGLADRAYYDASYHIFRDRAGTGSATAFQIDATTIDANGTLDVDSNGTHSINSGTAANTINFQSSHASGLYCGFYSGATAIGYIGDGGQLGTGFSTGTFGVTGAASKGLQLGSGAGMALEISTVGTVRAITPYSGGAADTLTMLLDGTSTPLLGFRNTAITAGERSMGVYYNASKVLYIVGMDNDDFQTGSDTIVAAFARGGAIRFPNHGTTANSANAVLDASDGSLERSTSSIRYKRDVRDLADEEVGNILSMRPVAYRSRIEKDGDGEYLGLIAEEVAAVDPRLCHYLDGRPDGVMYDRLTVLLLAEVQQLRAQVNELRLTH